MNFFHCPNIFTVLSYNENDSHLFVFFYDVTIETENIDFIKKKITAKYFTISLLFNCEKAIAFLYEYSKKFIP